ncbi:21 kDa seed protein-like [Hibiscus syriacus]|uniref:21 kDa seed protein-like n=1 Tax=Hibiscus syriacus TaxID=106335 RepID=UPI001921FD1A|nr:21 kDa seed protein-like [Hibiscus syriacus]
MKTMPPAVSFLFFLLSTSSFFSSVANAARKAVLDSEGKALRSGVQYYIVSTIQGAGGAALASRSVEKPCPKLVVLNGNQLGVRVLFYPDYNETTVYESTDVNIQFVPGADPDCKTSTTWKLDDYDPSSGRWWLTVGGL